MADKLKILVCNCFHTYFQKIALTEFKDMEILNLCSSCIPSNQNERSYLTFSETMTNHSGKTPVLICGGSLCPTFQLIVEGAVPIQIEKNNNCFSHLLGKELADNLIAQGAHLITETWLRSWREHIQELGLERERARRFYGEITSQLICISEDPQNEMIHELEDFSQYLNLPFSIIKPNYSCIRTLLQNLHNDWKSQNNTFIDSNENTFQVKQSADYITLLKIIRNLTSREHGPEIISTVQEGLSMLFSCKKVQYFPIHGKGILHPLDPVYSSFLKERIQYRVMDDNSGFLVKVEQAGHVKGILHIADFKSPQYILKYIFLTLDVAGVMGLALSNCINLHIIKEKEAEMEYIDTHDSMTGLFNRRLFDEKVGEFQQIQMKNGICIMICDLDGLKQINDTRGHSSGDRAIKATADILTKCFREVDILARIGGDEFAGLIPDYTEECIESLERRILENLDEYNEKNPDLKISFSIGFSHGYPSSDNLKTLIREADTMMYRAKREKSAELKFL